MGGSAPGWSATEKKNLQQHHKVHDTKTWIKGADGRKCTICGQFHLKKTQKGIEEKSAAKRSLKKAENSRLGS